MTSRPQMGPPCAEERHTTYRSLRSVHPFSHSSPFYPIPRNRMVCNGPDTSLEVLLPVGASALQSNKWFLGSAGLSVLNGISIGSAVFAGLTTVTDRPRSSVGNNRPHLFVRSTAMRPDNNNEHICIAQNKKSSNAL